MRIFVLGRSSLNLGMKSFMATMVVVMRAERQRRSASSRRDSSMNFSISTSRPRSCTSNPATSSIIRTKVLADVADVTLHRPYDYDALAAAVLG